MSARVPAFGSIGQQAKEVLTGANEGVYQYNRKLTWTTKTSEGVNLTSTFLQAGNNAADASLKAVYKTGNASFSASAQQTGKILGSLGYSNVSPGLSLTLTGTYPEASSGKLGVDYILPHVTVKSTVGLTQSPTVDASITTGNLEAYAGVDTTFNTSTNTLTKWTIGAGWQRKDFQVGVHLLDKGDTVKATYSHKVNLRTIVAGEVNHNIHKGDNTSIILGAQTRLDSGALVKARVDSDSIVSLHWEGLVHPDTTAGVSVQVNARDFDTPPRLGFFASAVKV